MTIFVEAVQAYICTYGIINCGSVLITVLIEVDFVISGAVNTRRIILIVSDLNELASIRGTSNLPCSVCVCFVRPLSCKSLGVLSFRTKKFSRTNPLEQIN